MDLDAVRTFVAVAEAGQFQEAAADLTVTQQAVSKRIAGLEKDLGVRLFTRTARGARLTIDGQAFLPHARALLQAEQRAVASVRPGRRALRVDAIGPNFGTEPLLETIADSPELATFAGAETRIVWPAQWDLRRIPVRDPTPVYPHSLVWRRDNPHPSLAALRAYLISPETGHQGAEGAGTWTPAWASRHG